MNCNYGNSITLMKNFDELSKQEKCQIIVILLNDLLLTIKQKEIEYAEIYSLKAGFVFSKDPSFGWRSCEKKEDVFLLDDPIKLKGNYEGYSIFIRTKCDVDSIKILREKVKASARG